MELELFYLFFLFTKKLKMCIETSKLAYIDQYLKRKKIPKDLRENDFGTLHDAGIVLQFFYLCRSL